MTLMRWMLLAAALLSKTAWAEVMDKEMPLAQVVGFGLIANVTAYLAARLKPWLLWLVVPLCAVFHTALVSETVDPYVGPAILQEAGTVYVHTVWFMAGTSVAGLVGGLAVRWWARGQARKRGSTPGQ